MDKSIAVLARTNRALLGIQQGLAEANIPFHVVGKSGFFQQPEIQAMLSYLSACSYPADYAISGILRTDFHPTKFLPRSRLSTRLKELKAADDSTSYWHLLSKESASLVESRNLEAVHNFVSFLHSLSRYKDLPATDALKSLYSLLKVGDHFAEQETEDNDPLSNLSDLLKISGRFRTIPEFLNYARKVTAASKSKKGVALSTIHSAKGLEFSSVYLVQCSEGILPHAKATDLDGERNAFFVACSRAEHKLTVTYSGVPSPFLESHLKSVQKMDEEKVL